MLHKVAAPEHQHEFVMDEEARLAALASYLILDTPPEGEFDRITRLAAAVIGVPTALICLVERDRVFVKAGFGQPSEIDITVLELSRRAMMSSDIFVSSGAGSAKGVSSGSVLHSIPGFFVGAALVAPSGHRLGSLCLLDTSPHAPPSSSEMAILKELASLVMDCMERRRFNLASAANLSRFGSVGETSSDGIVCTDSNRIITAWNKAAERIFGYTQDEVIGRSIEVIMPTHAEHIRPVDGDMTAVIDNPFTMHGARRDGLSIPLEFSLSEWSENGKASYGAIIRDVTQRSQADEVLRYAAEHDPLTGLANRASLQRLMTGACSLSQPATVMLLDLDGFQDVNDTIGHSAGDKVLQIVAARIRNAVAAEHVVARLGGDEFVVLIANNGESDAAVTLAKQLIAVIQQPIEYEDQTIHIGASIGVALRDPFGCDAEELLGNADLALYQAKADGRYLVRVFSPKLRQAARARTSTNASLREAWERKEFELYYQPQVRLADGALTGAEALIRWNHPTDGVVAPSAFLPMLESGLLAVPVGTWILRAACKQAAEWRRQGLADFRIGVNLFAAQFRSSDFMSTVTDALTRYNLPADALELEITENIILSNELGIGESLRALRALGVGIAFDDFGTGYASLSMLKQYPVTRLKIDRSFISNIQDNCQDQAIIQAVTKLASGFDLRVIAEGIETEAEARWMADYCDEGQGYLFGRPMPAAAFTDRFIAGVA